MKKILISSNTSWNIYNFRISLIKELLSRNIEIIILSSRDQYTDELIKIGCKFSEINIDRSTIGLFSNIMLFFNFLVKIKSINPDLILSYTIKPNIYASLAARLYKIKIYNTITGLGSSFLKNSYLKFLIIKFYIYSLKKSDLLIFQNRDDMKLFKKYNILNNQERDIIPGSGVDTDYFYYNENYNKNQITNFLFIGRIIKDKGVLELIQAFDYLKKRNHKIKLYLVGDLDQNNPSYISLSEIHKWEKNQIITFLGHNEDIRDKIIESDCVILPSYREGMPKSLLEASSMGRPIIATDVPGCREIVINNITGYLCHSKNTEDLIDKIELFLKTSSDKRILMGKNARKIILDRFDQKIIIDKYIRHIFKS
tara:strand:+ start:3538 stop:4644 length:1107 start_codon:yes stop_codon:yes gene_type:complete